MARKIEESLFLSGFSETEKEALRKIAMDFGCSYGNTPNTSKLIKKIASGELKLVRTNDRNLQNEASVIAELANIMIAVNRISKVFGDNKTENQQYETQHNADLKEHDAYYQEYIEPRKADEYVVIARHPLGGIIEVTGCTEQDAWSKFFSDIESFPENSINSGDAIAFALDDPQLKSYKLAILMQS